MPIGVKSAPILLPKVAPAVVEVAAVVAAISVPAVAAVVIAVRSYPSVAGSNPATPTTSST